MSWLLNLGMPGGQPLSSADHAEKLGHLDWCNILESGFSTGVSTQAQKQQLINGYPGVLWQGALPVFTGTVPDFSETFDTGTFQFDIGAYFTGADSYAIAPSVEVGWNFNTSTGVLTIDTDDAQTFGDYVVTATNAGGDTDTNAFGVIVSDVITGAGNSKRKKEARQKEYDQAYQDAWKRKQREAIQKAVDAEIKAGTQQVKPTLKLKKIAAKTALSRPEIKQISTIDDDVNRYLAIEFQLQQIEAKRKRNEALAILLLLN